MTVGLTYPGFVVLTVVAPSLQTYAVGAGAVFPVIVKLGLAVPTTEEPPT
ncbi:MAG: hypothetical protein IPL21_08165 [Saprospirales bacterium]|nr:hypothetical protein [Saprospirales bacterium]